MKFVLRERGGLVTRRDIADVLTAISPIETGTDYLRGYMDALIRIGLVYGVELIEQPSTLVEVTTVSRVVTNVTTQPSTLVEVTP